MNLTGQPPRQKEPKAKPNRSHMARVALLPCIVCHQHGLPQISDTTVHHVIHGRYSQRRSPDEATIPLCDGHHQGFFDTTKVAIHKQPSRWKQLYGEDHTFLPVVADMLAGQFDPLTDRP